jgi:hypothetical protein
LDWNAAIGKNREALRRVLAMLVAMAGLRGQFTFFPQDSAPLQGLALAEKSKLSPAPTLPRRLHRAVLRLLRPAEAAARRLAIVAARGIVVALPPVRLRGDVGAGTGAAGKPSCRRGFQLFDPLRPFQPPRPAASGVPRISVPGYSVLRPLAGTGRAIFSGEYTPTPPRCARHLSPTVVGERKGARSCGRRFLSPVERGRGVPPVFRPDA